jgi:flagellar motility protein MotE (MotC chaperone)
LARVNRQLVQKMRAQDSRADNDALATGVGVVLFWPALFFIKGDDEHAGELARLKGEFDAIEQAAIEKRCNLADEMQRARQQQKRYIEERNRRNQINQ